MRWMWLVIVAPAVWAGGCAKNYDANANAQLPDTTTVPKESPSGSTSASTSPPPTPASVDSAAMSAPQDSLLHSAKPAPDTVHHAHGPAPQSGAAPLNAGGKDH